MFWKCFLIAGLMAVLSWAPLRVNAHEPTVTLQARQFSTGACSGSFIAHDLPHVTTVNDTPIRLYESNGSGLAINDLNGDEQLDIVLANLDGPASIMWNEGGLAFRKQEISIRRTRAVSLVDVDGDGLNDVVFTGQMTPPAFWRNMGDEKFKLHSFGRVSHWAYALDWADVDADGDLDLVTGSYDADLEKTLKNSFLLGGGAGVFYYDNQAGQWVSKRLAKRSQALVIFLGDVNEDGQVDLAVGNDFAFPDQYWTLADREWTTFRPFTTTTYSTMSFAAGDINNDGRAEFLAADMKPYSTDPAVLKQWQPLLHQLEGTPRLTGDPQVIENILQSGDPRGGYINVAGNMGLSASGWSWSAQLGDLNSDGYLDAYVVNGMIALELFGQLPNSELVEENQAFRNRGGQQFEPALDWQLNSIRSGRGMTMADMDGDGDLDIVVNNLMSPAQLFENQLCGGQNLIVQLRQAALHNYAQIGAQVVLHTSTGTYRRQVRVSSGYLSGDPAQVHFGLPENSTIQTLEVHWTDGAVSHLSSVQADTLLTINRE